MHQYIKVFFFFWNDTLHVSDGLSVHHQEFKTVHTARSICQTHTAVCLLASRQQYVFDKCLLLYVQSWTPYDGRKDRPKHVERHSKIKQCQTDNAVCLLASRQHCLFDTCLLLYVQSWIPDDGRKDRPKHVECHLKIKQFGTLVHLVGFAGSSYLFRLHLGVFAKKFGNCLA